MFSDFDDKKHFLAGLKENRNVCPIAGMCQLPSEDEATS